MPSEPRRQDSHPPPGSPRRRASPARLWALLVLLVCLGATVWFANGERRRITHEADLQFRFEADRVASGIQSQLEDCEHLLRAFQSVFIASEEVTEEEFQRIYENMRPQAEHISLQALAYVERQRDGEGDRYITVVYAPASGNDAIRGLDVRSQPVNFDAMERSRDANEVAMSEPFRLRQSRSGADGGDGFILRLPVYEGGSLPTSMEERRARFAGSIGASFRISTLVSAEIPSAAATVAGVRLEDITAGGNRPLFEYGSGGAGSAEVRELEFGGRTWRVSIHRSDALAGQGAWRNQLWLGTAISLLLAALTLSLASTRERAVALGAAMSERYRASEERFRKLTELLPNLVLLAERPGGRVLYRNAGARDRLPADNGEGALAELFDEDAMQRLFRPDADGVGSAEVQMHGAGREKFWASVWSMPIEIDGDPMWLVVASDISEQRRLTERLSYQASHDPLTRLLNRREFEARLQALLSQPTRKPAALLFIDLDQFKLINDTSGHRAGDELLVQLAGMMREHLRPEDLLSRLGGDEFGVLLSGVGGIEAATLTAERLRRSLESFVFTWDRRSYMLSASIGGVMLTGATTLKEAFAHADAACYLAKEAGRNRVHFHSDDDHALSRRLSEMEWANRIRDAVRDDRMLLDYQEVRPLHADDEGVHVELLLRLRDTDGREVPPGAFVPAAERYGLMPLVDRWVLHAALANMDRLHPCGPALATCAINLSSASLEDEHFVDLVDGLLRRHGVDPARVVFELTETVAMRDFAASSQLVARLRGLGCKVALDDFGAGMSSFGYLKNLELDILKIDGSFVQKLEHDPMSQSIVRAVTEIGHQQGLAVVAEWVSSPAVIAILRELGVDYAQGFSLHAPERVVYQRPGA